MRPRPLTAVVATGALLVAASGVVAALVVDEDEGMPERYREGAAPAVSSPVPGRSPTGPVPGTPGPAGASGAPPAASPSPRPAATRPAPTSAPAQPSADPTGAAPGAATPSARPTRSRPTTRPTATPAPRPTGGRTYVVRPGDTLSEIAEWFDQEGFRRLYERNRDVIGSDPDLIRPGQRFTITATGALLMGSAAS